MDAVAAWSGVIKSWPITLTPGPLPSPLRHPPLLLSRASEKGGGGGGG